jgi:hypothetical protein
MEARGNVIGVTIVREVSLEGKFESKDMIQQAFRGCEKKFTTLRCLQLQSGRVITRVQLSRIDEV